MATSDDTSKLNVSLEPHLIEVLRPLSNLLSPPLADELRTHIEPPKDIIPYSTLLAISKWSRSLEGTEKLINNNPPLNLDSYTMIALLAGVKTSPERIFGTYTPPPGPEQLAEQQKRERKEITAIINGLLSVFGVGFATWYAAGTLHWKNQWRVLLALASSLVVAIAEGGLFIIWRSRQDAPKTRRRSCSMTQAVQHKKTDDDDATEANKPDLDMTPQPSEHTISSTNKLRQRRQ